MKIGVIVVYILFIWQITWQINPVTSQSLLFFNLGVFFLYFILTVSIKSLFSKLYYEKTKNASLKTDGDNKEQLRARSMGNTFVNLSFSFDASQNLQIEEESPWRFQYSVIPSLPTRTRFFSQKHNISFSGPYKKTEKNVKLLREIMKVVFIIIFLLILFSIEIEFIIPFFFRSFPQLGDIISFILSISTEFTLYALLLLLIYEICLQYLTYRNNLDVNNFLTNYSLKITDKKKERSYLIYKNDFENLSRFFQKNNMDYQKSFSSPNPHGYNVSKDKQKVLLQLIFSFTICSIVFWILKMPNTDVRFLMLLFESIFAFYYGLQTFQVKIINGLSLSRDFIKENPPINLFYFLFWIVGIRRLVKNAWNTEIMFDATPQNVKQVVKTNIYLFISSILLILIILLGVLFSWLDYFFVNSLLVMCICLLLSSETVFTKLKIDRKQL